jgi:hypothetical protein
VATSKSVDPIAEFIEIPIDIELATQEYVALIRI